EFKRMRIGILFLLGGLWMGMTIHQAHAQEGKFPMEPTIGFSGFQYLGDYSEPLAYPRIYVGTFVALQRSSRKHFIWQFQVGAGRFADQFDGEIPVNATGGSPSRFVQTRFIYGELRGVYRFFPQNRFQPYLSVGTGLTRFRPEDENGRRLIRRPDSVSSGAASNTIVPQLPASLGIKYRINRYISVDIRYTYRFIPTDYLDTYGQLGDQQDFDALQNLNLGFAFTLGPGPELPPSKRAKRKKERRARKEAEKAADQTDD
ncbi:MAG: hypothetical protein AAFR59_10300, partial [Bacteroidota bacterium]